MKKLNKLITMLVLLGGLFLVSCETTELDLSENPNALSPDQADADFFINAIQIDFAYLVESFGELTISLERELLQITTAVVVQTERPIGLNQAELVSD